MSDGNAGDDTKAAGPLDNRIPPSQQPAPIEPPTPPRPVPQDITNAGWDTPDAEDDSPETLDEAISQGDDVNDEPTSI